jgi:hypothetical protein
VIAASHALEYLREVQVIPDVVIHVDPNINIQKYLTVFELEKVELLILAATTAPSLFDLPTKNKSWIYANVFFDTWLMDLINVESFTLYGSSVSVAALKLAQTWGCSKIALMGQDLSFAKGKYYAGDIFAPDHVTEGFVEAEESNTYELPGYYGGKVLTKNDYRVYHGQFEQLAEEINQTGKVQLFNCTEGGANINGFENWDLQDFISDQLGQNGETNYSLKSQPMNELLTNSIDKRRIRANLTSTKRYLSSVEKLINAALDKMNENNFDDAYSEQIQNIQKKIAKKIKGSMFLKMALQDELSDLDLNEGYASNQKGYLEKGIEMYQTIVRVITKLQIKLSKLKIE